MTTEARAAADALGAAINTRDAQAIAALYSEDVIIWHASTQAGMTKTENVAMLAGIFAMTSRMEYLDIRRHDIEGGVVQQHRLVGTFDDGRALPDLHACMVFRVNDGKIQRIDEYFDGSVYAEVWERLGA